MPRNGRPWLVRADATQMRMLVTELVFNATDAMPRGGDLHVHVRATDVDAPVPGAVRQVTPGRYVELDVDNTGGGIAVEARAGGGTRVRVLLPCGTAEPATAAAS